MVTENNHFSSKKVTKESSVANASCRVYYGEAGAIPFMWESQPGTPKHKFSESSLPPLTPPPSYSTTSPSKKHIQQNPSSKAKFLGTIFPRLMKMVKAHNMERFDEVGKKFKRETDASHYQMGRRHMLGPPGTLNTITPCAACKLLRRRCSQECPFSPYFSPHEPQKFASVHKVFGASNVSKMLMEVPETQRADAANSLVYEANVRLRDPVYGCMGVISALQQQVQSLQAELNASREVWDKSLWNFQTPISLKSSRSVVKYKFRRHRSGSAKPPVPVPSLDLLPSPRCATLTLSVPSFKSTMVRLYDD
ncbi:hypothetical protein C1H46_028436 [Malus baccata]|uniref:LOB domain-containing protein n=1 Tax=Malus baccata TaxID=106549 RepID=A0A540LHQ9_MALBA|nr:hypothetical protein C1H46_028436 [Malus baccata]